MEKQITGIMVYYYHVCHRKLWYHVQGISMEQTHENVAIGKSLDESSYANEDKHINIHNVINIDFIREEGIIHEVKKSKAMEPASIEQVKYYLWYLEQEGVKGLRGLLHYPLLRRTLDIQLTDEDRKRIPNQLADIRRLFSAAAPPAFHKIKLCKNCAFCDICLV